MPRRFDHHYPLAADLTLPAQLDERGKLTCQPVPSDSATSGKPVTADMTWMLEVDYQASKRWALPAASTHQADQTCFTQYLEPGQSGKRLINLTGITRLDDIRLVSERCQLGKDAKLFGFTPPALDAGPLLILAPHPDDAELAAYGLYQRRPENSWIVTLTAGERQKRLDRQYLPGLDSNAASASRRKGEIRAWNSATTPLLAGLSDENLIMLGYFNDTLTELLDAPNQEHVSEEAPSLRPADFRRWNTLMLPTDAQRTDSQHTGPKVCGPHNRGCHLLDDLSYLIDHIQPACIVVTHPEIDPHPDHIATARALALALQHTEHQPDQILMYANHLKGIRGFPNGPAHAAAGVWPLQQHTSGFGPWRLYSETLSDEAIRQKAVALDSMHDLRATLRLEKRIKRWLGRRFSGVPASAWKDYGHHDYFQTHLKAHEVFAVVNAADFLAAYTE